MIDAHIHLETFDYTLEFLQKYIDQAQLMGIEEIHILEHTHHFKEWLPLYSDAIQAAPETKAWLLKHKMIPIQQYYDFIELARKQVYPIQVKFGLEVCYFPQKEAFIKEMLHDFNYDFAIGSIHYVHNHPYDLKGISEKLLWDVYPVNTIYEQYFDLVIQSVTSDLFTQIGHPDTIKMFQQYQPSLDFIPIYHRLAEALKKHHVIAENNVGCYYRYGHPDMGLSDDLLHILQEHGVTLTTSSDAHVAAHVGKHIADIYKKTILDKK